MRPTGGSAFGGIGLEGRSRPGPMRQRVDVFALGAHALCGVDCEGVAEPEQEPPSLRVREPLPVDLGRLTRALRRTRPVAVLRTTSTMSPLLPIVARLPSISATVFRYMRSRSPVAIGRAGNF